MLSTWNGLGLSNLPFFAFVSMKFPTNPTGYYGVIAWWLKSVGMPLQTHWLLTTKTTTKKGDWSCYWTKHKPGHLGERSPKLTCFPSFSGLQRLPKAQETRTATVGQNGSKHTQPLYGYDETQRMQAWGLLQVEQSSDAYTIIHTYDSRFCWFEWINFESTLWISADRFTSGMTRIYLYPISHSTESHA